MATVEPRSIYSGPIRRALTRLDEKLDLIEEAGGVPGPPGPPGNDGAPGPPGVGVPPGGTVGQVLGKTGTADYATGWVTGGGGSGGDEVFIGPAEPADTFELWVDTDEATPITDDLRWNTAWGVRQRAFKSSTQGGFGAADAVTGLELTIPNVTGRFYRIYLSLRIIPTTVPTATNSIIGVTLRQGTTVAGTAIAVLQWPSIVHSNTYGWNLNGTFPVGAYTPGQTYCLSTWTDGTTRWTITDASWAMLEDVGPQTGFQPAPNPTPAWQNCTLANSWVSEPGMTAQWRMIGDVVYLRGSIQRSGAFTAYTDAVVNLPLPARQERFGVLGHKGGVGGVYKYRCDLMPTGKFMVSEIDGAGLTEPVVYLNGVSYSVTP